MSDVSTRADPGRGLNAGITGWQRVSPKLIGVELAAVAVGLVIGCAVGVLLLAVATPIPWLGWIVIGLAVVITAVRAAIATRRVRAIGYVLRDDDLVVRRGIILSRVVAVPYGRMQLIDVNRGPVARLLGLADLRLVTAAAGSDVTLPGLPEAAAATLRDTLVERAESRRVGL